MSFLDKLKGKISNTFDKYIDDPDLKKYADKLLKKDSFTTISFHCTVKNNPQE